MNLMNVGCTLDFG